MNTIIQANPGWSSLVVRIVGAGTSVRLSEWNTSAAERPTQVLIEGFPIIAWALTEDRRGNKIVYNREPICDHPRAELADLREMPGGSIRLRSGEVVPNRGSLARTLLHDVQRRWDAAHPITDAPAPADAAPDAPTGQQK